MLLTKWGEALDREHPLSEYPRPQLRRGSYLNLNGVWDCAFTRENSEPVEYDCEIVVPFPPESALSGVERVLQPDEYLWYRREFALPEGFNAGRVLLHFGAVDQTARVWLNGEDVCVHTGGFLPFSADITELLTEGANTLVVRVTDGTDRSYHTRGKQKLKPGGIWYTPVSGIWQTVWCESVPENYITSLFITPHLEDGSVELNVGGEGTVRAVIDGADAYEFAAGESTLLKLKDVRPWTPEEPYLYKLELALGEDRVESYFALRSVGIGEDRSGKKRLLLNGKPCFMNGLLDQGWWPDGLYTAPSDEALRFEICVSVSGVHYPEQTGHELHAVFHLLSMTYNRRIRLEVEVSEDDPHLPSLVPVYPMANFHERETWDMFGIIFDGHPALTRILMPDDWVGHPQRKDYPLGGIPVEFKGAVVPPADDRRSYNR